MSTSTSTSSKPQTSTSSSSRSVLCPVADSDCCSQALRWALQNVARPGDTFHLAYVREKKGGSRVSSPPSLSPSPPSPSKNPFCPEDPLAAQAELHSSRAMIGRRFAPLLEAAGVPYEVHLLEPTEAADRDRSEGIGEALRSLGAELQAELVVVGGVIVDVILSILRTGADRHAAAVVELYVIIGQLREELREEQHG